jgi:hypothetical protein
MNDAATCTATKDGRTAEGPITIHCAKPAGHDGRHEGRTGTGPGMPVYWVDEHVTSPPGS